MANSIWDPTQYQVDYSATGDDVDKLAQQYIALVNGVFDLLNMMKAWSARAFEPAEKSAYLVWADTTDSELKLRNADNSAWITLGKLTNKLGMTPAYIGAVKDGGLPEIIVGLEVARPNAGIEGRWFAARDKGRVWRDSGTEWDLLLSKNWEDTAGKPEVFPPASHTHAAVGSIPIDESNKAVGKTLVLRMLGETITAVYETPSGGGGGGGAFDDLSNTRTDAGWTCYFLNMKFTNVNTAISNKQDKPTYGPLADRPAAGIVNREYVTTDSNPNPNILYRDTGTEWVQLGANVNGKTITLLHATDAADADTAAYELLYQSQLIADTVRHSNKLRFALISSGQGQCQIKISDGTTTVAKDMAAVNSVQDVRETVNIDCSGLQTLVQGKVWSVEIYGKTTGTLYTVKRVNLFAPVTDDFAVGTVILANPGTQCNSAVFTALDTAYFPINYAIDNTCVIRFLGVVTLGAGVTGAELKCRLTAAANSQTSTEEVVVPVASSGIVQGYVQIPALIAPTVKVEVFGRITAGTGVVTLSHYECWLEV